MIRPIEVGNCYRIAGRPAIVITSMSYDGGSKRTSVKGYSPGDYGRYLKFHTIDRKTQKSLAQLEGISPDSLLLKEFRFNSKSKIVKLDIKAVVPGWAEAHRLYATDDLDGILKQPRKELAI